MARTTIAAQANPTGTGYPATPLVANSADVVLAAADVPNKNQLAHTGRQIIVASNSGATAHTVTITSVADSFNRVGDITAYSLGAAEVAIFGPFPTKGWKQDDGFLYFEANHAEILFGVITLPIVA